MAPTFRFFLEEHLHGGVPQREALRAEGPEHGEALGPGDHLGGDASAARPSETACGLATSRGRLQNNDGSETFRFTS